MDQPSLRARHGDARSGGLFGVVRGRDGNAGFCCVDANFGVANAQRELGTVKRLLRQNSDSLLSGV